MQELLELIDEHRKIASNGDYVDLSDYEKEDNLFKNNEIIYCVNEGDIEQRKYATLVRDLISGDESVYSIFLDIYKLIIRKLRRPFVGYVMGSSILKTSQMDVATHVIDVYGNQFGLEDGYVQGDFKIIDVSHYNPYDVAILFTTVKLPTSMSVYYQGRTYYITITKYSKNYLDSTGYASSLLK